MWPGPFPTGGGPFPMGGGSVRGGRDQRPSCWPSGLFPPMGRRWATHLPPPTWGPGTAEATQPCPGSCSVSLTRSPLSQLPALEPPRCQLQSVHRIGLLSGGSLPAEPTAHVSPAGPGRQPMDTASCLPIRQLENLLQDFQTHLARCAWSRSLEAGWAQSRVGLWWPSLPRCPPPVYARAAMPCPGDHTVCRNQGLTEQRATLPWPGPRCPWLRLAALPLVRTKSVSSLRQDCGEGLQP